MNTYTAHAHRWDGGWELHIDGLGVTQSRTLRDAEGMVRSYVSLDTGEDRNSFAVEILPDLAGLEDKVRLVKGSTAKAEEAQRKAAAMTRSVVRELKAWGLSGNDIAAVLKVSAQRVSQLAKPEPTQTPPGQATHGEGLAARSTSRAHQRGKVTRTAGRP